MSSSAPVRIVDRPFWLLVTIFLFIEIIPIFETTMMSTAIPTMMAAFGVDTAAVSWFITIFLLVGAGTAAIAGRLGDLYGRRRVLIALMIISALGSVVSALTGTFVGVVIGRALQGTSAGFFPLLIGLAREAAPANKVTLLSSLTSGVSVIDGALGALGAGILLDTSSWHSLFIVISILAVIGIPLALLLPQPEIAGRGNLRIDILGALLLAPSVAAILYGVTIARNVGFSGLVISLVFGGAALFALWIVWELKISEPMFNLRMFRNPSLVLATVTTGLAAVGVMGAPALLTPILQQSPVELPVGLGLTPTMAGVYGLIGGVFSFILSPFAGKLAGKRGARLTLLIAVGLATIGYALFIVSVHNLVLAVVASVIGSVGVAMIVVSMPLVIVEIVPPEDTSEAVALIYVVGRTVFTAVGTAVIGLLLVSDTVPNSTAPTLGAWNWAVVFTVITGVIGFATALAIKKAKPLDQRGEDPGADSSGSTATPPLVSGH